MPDYRLGLLGGNLFQHPLCSSCLYWFWSKSASMLYSKFWFSESSSGQMGKIFLAFLVMGWIVWRHRENLARLKAGTENRFEKKSKS